MDEIAAGGGLVGAPDRGTTRGDRVAMTLGSRVIVDQSRFKSGRDPGRRREVLQGTISKFEENDCEVEFDKPVIIKGKKHHKMRMKHHYVSPVKED